MKLEQEVKEQSEAGQKAKEAERKAKALQEFNATIARAEAQKKLLGDAKPTPLSGNVTISNSETAMAETRALTYRSLNALLECFVKNIKGKKGGKKKNDSEQESVEGKIKDDAHHRDLLSYILPGFPRLPGFDT